MSTNWKMVTKKKRSAKPPSIFPIISSDEALHLQKSMNIDRLASVLLSSTSINLQRDGWKYQGVFTPKDPLPKTTNEVEYAILPIPNKWSDKIVFYRLKTEPERIEIKPENRGVEDNSTS